MYQHFCSISTSLGMYMTSKNAKKLAQFQIWQQQMIQYGKNAYVLTYIHIVDSAAFLFASRHNNFMSLVWNFTVTGTHSFTFSMVYDMKLKVLTWYHCLFVY